MKKQIIIGDPHGRWDPIIKAYNKESPDKVIILGDYFDSFRKDPYDQYDCYKNIIQLRNFHIEKTSNSDDFIMLIGNHDMHYISDSFGRCSGWNYTTNSLSSPVLANDFYNGILKLVYIDEKNKIIYSHAGISKNWFNSRCKKSLNEINKLSPKDFKFSYKGGGDCYGSSSYNSPLWIRPEGLKTSPYTDKDNVIWTQIFGHTETEGPDHFKVKDGDFYSVDCMTRYYLVELFNDDGLLIERYIESNK